MNQETFFSRYGKTDIKTDHIQSQTNLRETFTIEKMYQMFKARLLLELYIDGDDVMPGSLADLKEYGRVD